MHLTRYTDYSLRVLIYLAVRPDGFGTVQSIAEAYDISRNHLMKVVQQLNKRGYIVTVRGKGGGMRLRLEPDQINMGDVIRDMESEFVIVECLGDHNRCVIACDCKMKEALADAQRAFMQVLEQYTLGDVICERGGLQRALQLDVIHLEEDSLAHHA